MKTNETNKCFICKKVITEKDMTAGKVEMINGPDFKKVFVCTCHEGITEEVKKEDSESGAADHQYYK